MATIQETDINNLNATVYSLGTNSKFNTSLPTKLQSSTDNNATTGSKITNVNITELKNAINILEQKFSNNCCQAQCHTYSTVSSCQVSTCQKCQACQYCQGCQSTTCQSCQAYNQYSVSNCNGGL